MVGNYYYNPSSTAGSEDPGREWSETGFFSSTDYFKHEEWERVRKSSGFEQRSFSSSYVLLCSGSRLEQTGLNQDPGFSSTEPKVSIKIKHNLSDSPLVIAHCFTADFNHSIIIIIFIFYLSKVWSGAHFGDMSVILLQRKSYGYHFCYIWEYLKHQQGW